ncbi:MAG: Bcr/CflA family drug resistance efflux transporter, partial [Pikeienuella sp.]
ASRVGINPMMLIGCFAAAIGIGIGVLVNVFIVDHPLAVFGFCIFVGFGNGMTLPSATTGILSVRPELAGSASGLGASMMMLSGALLSALTGAILTVETGALPLLLMMLLSASLSVVTAFYVIRRTRCVQQTTSFGSEQN